MKVKYEYDVVVNDEALYFAATRQMAREFKNIEKEFGCKAKIVQRKYVLTETKEVR